MILAFRWEEGERERSDGDTGLRQCGRLQRVPIPPLKFGYARLEFKAVGRTLVAHKKTTKIGPAWPKLGSDSLPVNITGFKKKKIQKSECRRQSYSRFVVSLHLSGIIAVLVLQLIRFSIVR